MRACWKSQFDHCIDLLYVAVAAFPILFHWFRSRNLALGALHGFEVGVRAAMSSSLVAAVLLLTRLWFPIGDLYFYGDVDRVSRMFLGVAILVPTCAVLAATIVPSGLLVGMLFRRLDGLQFAPAALLQTILIPIAVAMPVSAFLSHALYGASVLDTIKRLFG